jgi:hypothetical protein
MVGWLVGWMVGRLFGWMDLTVQFWGKNGPARSAGHPSQHRAHSSVASWKVNMESAQTAPPLLVLPAPMPATWPCCFQRQSAQQVRSTTALRFDL